MQRIFVGRILAGLRHARVGVIGSIRRCALAHRMVLLRRLAGVVFAVAVHGGSAPPEELAALLALRHRRLLVDADDGLGDTAHGKGGGGGWP